MSIGSRLLIALPASSSSWRWVAKALTERGAGWLALLFLADALATGLYVRLPAFLHDLVLLQF